MCWKQQDLSKKVHISEAEIAEENNRTTSFGEKGLFICRHICLCKQLPQLNSCCQEVMRNNEMTSLWSNHCLMLVAYIKNDYQVAVSALILSPRTVPNMSVYGPDHHFQDQWLDGERCYLIFCILQSVSVDQSGGLSMEIGILYLSRHAMLVLAELTVCSTRGSACILA